MTLKRLGILDKNDEGNNNPETSLNFPVDTKLFDDMHNFGYFIQQYVFYYHVFKHVLLLTVLLVFLSVMVINDTNCLCGIKKSSQVTEEKPFVFIDFRSKYFFKEALF